MESIPQTRLIDIFRRVASKRGWGLLGQRRSGITEADLVAAMQRQLEGWLRAEKRTRDGDNLLERAAVAAYCEVLHSALDSTNQEVQTRALEEIRREVSKYAQTHLRDESERQAIVDRVVQIIWEKHDTVLDPARFLAWCGVITSHEIYHAAQQQGREVPLVADDADDQGEEHEAFRRHISTDQPLLSRGAFDAERSFAEVEQQSTISYFEGLIRRCLSSRDQQEAFIRLVLHEMDVADVARELNTTPGNIHVLRWRASRGLQRCRILLDALGRHLEQEVERKHA
jgi:DNA-directed RNA polymerase specialized sigma24 family protein